MVLIHRAWYQTLHLTHPYCRETCHAKIKRNSFVHPRSMKFRTDIGLLDQPSCSEHAIRAKIEDFVIGHAALLNGDSRRRKETPGRQMLPHGSRRLCGQDLAAAAGSFTFSFFE
jgi:hypothetical protein